MTGEFQLIREFFMASEWPPHVLLGVGDDGALLQTDATQALVVVTDTSLANRHFPAAANPFDIGYRALAVNLSDIAAMGARPKWMLLNLTLPDVDRNWLRSFSAGLHTLAKEHDVSLVGGDTTRGELAITITVIGEVTKSNALLRSGARVGDQIAVTGELGLAAAALKLWRAQQAIPDELHRAWLRPHAQLQAGQLLGGIASAAIDISDGLAADLGHLLRASDVGAHLDMDVLPVNPLLAEYFPGEENKLMLGGDDYQLCFTFAATHREDIARRLAEAGIGFSVCGEIRGTSAGYLVTMNGQLQDGFSLAGFDHFGEVNEG